MSPIREQPAPTAAEHEALGDSDFATMARILRSREPTEPGWGWSNTPSAGVLCYNGVDIGLAALRFTRWPAAVHGESSLSIRLSKLVQRSGTLL
jgi:hypothetical protein